MNAFKKYYVIPAPPEEVYNALTNPLAIRLWTGEPVTMSAAPVSEEGDHTYTQRWQTIRTSLNKLS